MWEGGGGGGGGGEGGGGEGEEWGIVNEGEKEREMEFIALAS